MAACPLSATPRWAAAAMERSLISGSVLRPDSDQHPPLLKLVLHHNPVCCVFVKANCFLLRRR